MRASKKSMILGCGGVRGWKGRGGKIVGRQSRDLRSSSLLLSKTYLPFKRSRRKNFYSPFWVASYFEKS